MVKGTARLEQLAAIVSRCDQRLYIYAYWVLKKQYIFKKYVVYKIHYSKAKEAAGKMVRKHTQKNPN